ncbi:MAG: hypothetical protein H0W86_05980 [Armatimonadetes bacterium]|nr:hypothetical protein [Armatimonadota bacterium]
MKAICSCLVLLSGLLAGCGAANPMVGTWKMDIAKETADMMGKAGAPPAAGQIEFKDDGTFALKMTGLVKAETSGDYDVHGKKVTLNPKNTGAPPTEGTLSEDGKTFTARGMKFVKE